ncbi:MAG: hypothetical protein J1F35_05920 [Erysipelotrichales bacterium]|nr:hypothetical protein [Erysipelotrichales bacterium]
MGTNFYLRRKISEKDKQNVIEQIYKDNWIEARDLVYKLTERVHIGKRSSGWQFLWNANRFEYFSPNIESLQNWLKSGIIEDEYGREFTFEEFWNDEIKDFLYEGWNLEKYYSESGNTWFGRDIPYYFQDKLDKFDIDKYGEFVIDGLRFTITEEFS